MQCSVGFVIEFGRRLGDDGVRLAKEILATRADWLDRWLPQLTARPGMRVPHWLEQGMATRSEEHTAETQAPMALALASLL